MLTHHFIIKGRVQGVGYRITAQLNAVKIGITGTVKNLDNGDVEVFAQGTSNQIQVFKKYLKTGSFFSKTTEIIEEVIEMEKFESFTTIY